MQPANKNWVFNDPEPSKINIKQWSRLFGNFPVELIQTYKYYDNSSWGLYLQPPATFMVYGTRELQRLKLDNSLAALRLWGFSFNESERLFRARQSGRHVIATMGDLGIVPVIVSAFKDCIPFYPDCTWWMPFFNESTVLLDTASDLGVPEASCFVRAALSAFYKKAYFPKPELIFASTGASCDDYSSIMQLVETLGHELTWLEIPFRRELQKESGNMNLGYDIRFEKYLVKEYQIVWEKMIKKYGNLDLGNLWKSIQRANFLRKLVADLKEFVYGAEIAPLPALEMMVIEFGNLYGYADIDEWVRIVQMIHETVQERINKKIGVLAADAIPIAWVTPTADPYLLNLIEDLGCRIIETEYVINQALVTIDESLADPFQALARAFMQASLIGSTRSRVERIIKLIEQKKVKGVLITNMLGCSHCAMETRLIERLLGNVPVLSVDIPAPFGITEQIRARLAAFVETISQ